MYAVIAPVIGGCAFYSFIEEVLKADVDVGVVGGDGVDEFASLVDVGVEVQVGDHAALGHERLAQHDFHVGQGVAGSLEQGPVQGVEAFERGAEFGVVLGLAVPGVVYADQYRSDRGSEIKAVRVPAVGEVADAVAADATVVALDAGVI